MLVIDANVAVRACGRANGFTELSDEALVARPLMWSESVFENDGRLWRGTKRLGFVITPEELKTVDT
jgi:hypothetical protein